MKDKKLPIFAFAFVFSFLVWLSVNLGNTFQTTIDLPIVIENLRPIQAIASPLPPHVTLRVQGTGWQLINTFLTPNLHYTIDFGSMTRRDTIFTFKNVAERINAPKDLVIFETYPETVVVRLDQKISKSIRLQPELTASYREGFDRVGSVLVEPESITVTGARSVLSALNTWKTIPVTLKDINTPVSVNIPIADSLINQVTLSHTSARMYFDVQPIAEKTIDNIPVEVNQIPGTRNVVLIPPTVSIIIRSGVNAVAPLTEKDFYAFVDYKSILLDTSGFVQPIILGPENIKIVNQQPEKIQYVVRK
jgi:hypothetical protein